MITHISLSLYILGDWRCQVRTLSQFSWKTGRRERGPRPTMAVTRALFFFTRDILSLFICDCRFFLLLHGEKEQDGGKRENNLQICWPRWRGHGRVVSGWEKRFLPVDWPFGGKRGVETADNEMDVCRHVCGRIFEGEDDDVRVEGSTVFFFSRQEECGNLWIPLGVGDWRVLLSELYTASAASADTWSSRQDERRKRWWILLPPQLLPFGLSPLWLNQKRRWRRPVNSATTRASLVPRPSGRRALIRQPTWHRTVRPSS